MIKCEGKICTWVRFPIFDDAGLFEEMIYSYMKSALGDDLAKAADKTFNDAWIGVTRRDIALDSIEFSEGAPPEKSRSQKTGIIFVSKKSRATNPALCLWLIFIGRSITSRSGAAAGTSIARADSSFDATLYLEAARNRLVVLQVLPTGLDVCFDLQADSLVVIRGDRASLDATFDLEATRHILVVVLKQPASLEVGLNSQTAGHRLIVVGCNPPGFDVALNLQTASRSLIVVDAKSVGIDTAFDLHTASLIVVKLAPAGFDVALDLQASRLVVVYAHLASLDVGLDLQTATHCLVVLNGRPPSFDFSLDFHTFPSPYEIYS